MDWEKLAWTWGPAMPVMLALLKILSDCVYKQIPAGFASIRSLAITHELAAKERHGEHMKAQRDLCRRMDAICHKPATNGKPKRRRKSTRG